MWFINYSYNYSGNYNSYYYWASGALLCSILHINTDAKIYTVGIIIPNSESEPTEAQESQMIYLNSWSL